MPLIMGHLLRDTVLTMYGKTVVYILTPGMYAPAHFSAVKAKVFLYAQPGKSGLSSCAFRIRQKDQLHDRANIRFKNSELSTFSPITTTYSCLKSSTFC